MHETSNPGSRWRFGRRRLLLLAVAVMAMIIPGAALSADVDDPPADVEVLGQFGDRTAFTGPLGRIYGPGDGWAVISGDPLSVICDGANPPKTLGLTNQRGDGTWRNEIPFGGVERKLFLYETEPGVDVFSFLGASCAAVAGGGTAPEPFAYGYGNQRAEQWDLAEPFWSFLGPQPPGRYRNSISSNDVFDEDGNRYRVAATANYRVDEEGSTEFLKHSVQVIARD